jgi:3-deoxy-D-manno-octulosonic-acid transferase
VYLLYDLFLVMALLISSPYWLMRLLRQGKYRSGLGQRLGTVPPQVRALAATGKPLIWVHAVSVGEILAIAGLVQQMRARFASYTIAISSTTATGYALAGARFGAESVFYFPLDLRWAVGRYVRLLRPRLVVLAETEFWPNFLRAARRSGARLLVVNARISDRSYPRYRCFSFLLRRVLRDVDSFLAQSEEDAQRLRAIGADAQRVRVAGNLKFETARPAASQCREQLQARIEEISAAPLVVFGSTVEGEEALLIETFRRVSESHPRAIIILAPRHKERFATVAGLLQAAGIPFARRSDPRWPHHLQAGQMLLLDSIGELAAIYSLASVAFVGGSLAPRGGHNILEPASFAVPTLVGPHTESFRDIVRRFEAAGGVLVVRDEHELLATMLRLLADPVERKRVGERGYGVLHENQGATERTLAEIEKLLMPQNGAGGAAGEPRQAETFRGGERP